MTTTPDIIAPAVITPRRAARSHPAIEHLLGIGTAVPEPAHSQDETERIMASLWSLNNVQRERWRRIIAGSGIEKRHGVLPPQDVIHLSTAQRMAAYEQHATPLATKAASNAMHSSGVPADCITDLIVVSCTGFAAPGLDAGLMRVLNLAPTVRRTTIGFMGCFGAISGLRAAVGACAADPSAVALVVCLELCSLHMRADCDAQNLVASALFADGAAAAVVSGNGNGKHHPAIQARSAPVPLGSLNLGASLVIDRSADWMTWRITDAGFAMTLARQVPQALREQLAEFIEDAYGPHRPDTFAIHPGGPGILDAADEALGLQGGHGLEASRAVLREFGNMSSATVLFVLDKLLRCGNSPPILMVAFGPGLTIESMPLLAGG